MARYLFRCRQHGVFEVVHPIGTAPARGVCPECSGAAARVFTAPQLAFGSRSRSALIERTERSAERPEVVSAPPPRPPRPALPGNPAWARLPRL